MSALSVRIIKPEREVARIERASMLVGESTGGQFAVLPDHTSFCAKLRIALMEVRVDKGRFHRFAICGGVIKVSRNQVDVCTESAEISKEIDTGRAEAAMKRARERLDSGDDSVDRERAESALRRAMVRLKVASFRQG